MRIQARNWLAAVVAVVLLGGPTGTQRAEDKPGGTGRSDQKALDKKVYEALKTVINAGADLYNRDQDRAGCYRLYQGSLLTLRPLLDDRPDLQKEIDAGLTRAESQANVGARAHALREVLGKIRDTLKPVGARGAPPPIPVPPKSTPGTTPAKLWERLGGEANVRKIVDDFVASGLKDPKVNFDRGGKINLDAAAMESFKKNVVAFISQGSGGPLKYTGKSVKEVHKGMGITNAEFDAAVADLRQAFQKNGVKEADLKEVLKAIEALRKDVVERK